MPSGAIISSDVKTSSLCEQAEQAQAGGIGEEPEDRRRTLHEINTSTYDDINDHPAGAAKKPAC